MKIRDQKCIKKNFEKKVGQHGPGLRLDSFLGGSTEALGCEAKKKKMGREGVDSTTGRKANKVCTVATQYGRLSWAKPRIRNLRSTTSSKPPKRNNHINIKFQTQDPLLFLMKSRNVLEGGGRQSRAAVEPLMFTMARGLMHCRKKNGNI